MAAVSLQSSAAQRRQGCAIDSREPTIPLEEYAYNETRYRMLRDGDPERADELMRDARHDAEQRRRLYLDMAARAKASRETVTQDGEYTGNRQAHTAFCAELPRPGPDSRFPEPAAVTLASLHF